MARYLKPVCKMSRRIGVNLSLKGVGGRDISTKCKMKAFPGQHVNKKKKPSGNYLLQLTAKQMIKFTYGLLEKQFRHFLKRVSSKKGSTGEFLLKLLESRLDNVVYRMGFSLTRAEARQLVSHRSIVVITKDTERVISIPSYIVKKGDVVKISEKSKDQIRIQYALKCAEKNRFVDWVNVDVKNMSGVFLRVPERKELPKELNEQMVIEFYSR